MSTNRQVRVAEERANRSIARYRADSNATVRGIKNGRKGTWRKPDGVVAASLKKAAKDVQRSQRIRQRLR